MRRAIPGCIAAISSTVSVPCFVVARTREPGIGGSSMAVATASGSRTFRVSVSLLDACPTMFRPRSRPGCGPRATDWKRNSYESKSIGADVERSLTRRRDAIASFVSLVLAVFLAATALGAAGVPNRPPYDTPPVPNGIGAGIYFVSGTADYAFELTERGEYYLIVSADRGSTMDASLSQNGTRLSPDWVGHSGMTLIQLERGTYDLHLVGSGKVAVGWNFVFSGVQQFPANQRLVAALRSEEHTSELQSLTNLVCRLLLEKKKDTLRNRDTLKVKISSVTLRRVKTTNHKKAS